MDFSVKIHLAAMFFWVIQMHPTILILLDFRLEYGKQAQADFAISQVSLT